MAEQGLINRRWWAWLGLGVAVGNAALAVVALLNADLFLFLVGVCVAWYVALPLWEIRGNLWNAE